MRVAILSTYPPRVCGIATFAQDLRGALLASADIDAVDVIAIAPERQEPAHPAEVVLTVAAGDPGAFRAAAAFCDDAGYDAVLVQHEFGIYGGVAGRHVLEFADRVRAPVVSTAHTVLGDPPADLRAALHDLSSASARMVTLTGAAVPLLRTAHDVDPARIAVIPHGVRDVPLDDPAPHKVAVGLEGHRVLLTFGLLSRNKGIELVLDALPKVVAGCPDLRYVVLGATHPEAQRTEGESYRRSLEDHVARLGLTEHVEFRDRYVDDDELDDHLLACDVYVTPYQSREQITSGTLAYAVGMGRAVVSTPYRHAEELLGDGRGLLVPFGDADALAEAVARLLRDDDLRERTRRLAHAHGRGMTWPRVGVETAALLSTVVTEAATRDRVGAVSAAGVRAQEQAGDPALCARLLRLDHLEALTDDVGILQHATHGVPDRRFGYTTDDQSRAMLAAVEHHARMGDAASERLAMIYLSYLQLAQLPDGRFRNTMDYSRRWVDDGGTEDTVGQSVWALGVTAERAPTAGMGALAGELLAAALPAADALRHVRAIAYALCGLSQVPDHQGVAEAAERLAQRLVDAFARERRPGWDWCDTVLSYANTKVPEALLRAATAFDRPDWGRVGVDSLEFVLHATRTEDCFDFVGNEAWRTRGGSASVFAQQPIEAGYTAQACLVAADVTGDDRYQRLAVEAVAWLLGRNRLGLPLYDAATGVCADGLERTGVSGNGGAESVVCALLGLLAVSGDVAPWEP